MGQERDTALRYLLRVSRTRTTLRPYTIVFLIREWILAGQYQRAHEELTSIIGAYPYRHQPQLHTYLGLLTLYLGNVDEAECSDSDSSSSIPHVPMRLAKQVPHHVQRSARLHFENAIKVAPRYMAKQTAICKHRLRQTFDSTVYGNKPSSIISAYVKKCVNMDGFFRMTRRKTQACKAYLPRISFLKKKR